MSNDEAAGTGVSDDCGDAEDENEQRGPVEVIGVEPRELSRQEEADLVGDVF